MSTLLDRFRGVGKLSVLMLALLALPCAAHGSLTAQETATLRAAVQAYASLTTPAAEAKKLGYSLENADAHRLLLWLHLQEDSATDTRFEDYAQFLSRHPDWPRRTLIALQAERRLTGSENAKQMRSFFSDYPPQTLNGLRAAIAAFAQSDSPTQELIRTFWRSASLTAEQQSAFLQTYRRQLRAADLHLRADQLLLGDLLPEEVARKTLSDQLTDAKVLRAAQAARTAMITQTRSRTAPTAKQRATIEALIAKVPKDVRAQGGFVYDQARWLESLGEPLAAARLLEAHPAQPHGDAGYNFTTRDLIARDLIEQGRPELAYRIASAHGITAAQDGNAFRDSEWLSGWIALRFLGKAETAQQHFERMFKASTAVISRARGAYWLGRSAMMLEKPERAAQWYETAAHLGPTTYYGQLAALERYPDQRVRVSVPTLSRPEQAVRDAFEERSLTRAARLAQRADLRETFRTLSTALAESAKSQSEATLALEFAAQSNWPEAAAWAARRAAVQGFTIGREGYPVLRGLPPAPEGAVTHAIIRQESTFDASAVSPAGALGLMQLMPATAQAQAKRLGLSYSRARLSEPTYNAQLGSDYLQRRIEEFDGSYILAFAAYNAGAARPRQWLERFGPMTAPRLPYASTIKNTPLWQVIDWVEMIPFPETRNYVMRVSEALGPYRAILAPERKVYLSLDKDLLR